MKNETSPLVKEGRTGEIITTVLIILLVLAAIYIVYTVVQTTLKDSKPVCGNTTTDRYLGTFQIKQLENYNSSSDQLKTSFYNFSQSLIKDSHIDGDFFINCSGNFNTQDMFCSGYDRTVNVTCTI